MLKASIPLILLSLLLTGCPSAPDPDVLEIKSSIDSGDYEKLDEIELLILDYKINAGPAPLQEAERLLVSLLAEPSLNKDFEARVHGLYGEVLFFLGNTRAARGEAEKAAQLRKSEPQLYLLQSLLEKDPTEGIAILEEARGREIQSGRMLLELAELYFATGEYGKATAFYDEAFTLLSAPYTTHYQKNREVAFQFIDSPPEDPGARDYIGLEELLISDVMSILLLQSSYLDAIVARKEIDQENLLALLKSEGLFYSPALARGDRLLRRDAAYLLLAIIARLEGEPGMMDTYSAQFTAGGQESPVPDVKVSDYFFDAVLNLVEREIMELPDGINFQPTGTVSGVEFYDMLKALKLYYGY